MNTSARLVKSVRRIELNPLLGEYVYAVDELCNMTIPKTNAQRQADLKARRVAAGLVPVTNLWSHPDDVTPIREHAAKLARKRELEAKTASSK